MVKIATILLALVLNLAVASEESCTLAGTCFDSVDLETDAGLELLQKKATAHHVTRPNAKGHGDDEVEYAKNAEEAVFAENAQYAKKAMNAENAEEAMNAMNADNAMVAKYAQNSEYAINAETAEHVCGDTATEGEPEVCQRLREVVANMGGGDDDDDVPALLQQKGKAPASASTPGAGAAAGAAGAAGAAAGAAGAWTPGAGAAAGAAGASGAAAGAAGASTSGAGAAAGAAGASGAVAGAAPQSPSLVEEAQQSSGEDVSAFWQSNVHVATDMDDAEFESLEIASNSSSALDVDKVCGKAAVNIHAGARVHAIGFPTEINFDTKLMKSWILGELATMPTKAAAAVAKMVEDCTGIPGLSGAVSSLDGIMKEAAQEMAGVIPDFEISFGAPEMLYETPDGICVNVWKDTLPKGQTCGTYNVEC